MSNGVYLSISIDHCFTEIVQFFNPNIMEEDNQLVY